MHVIVHLEIQSKNYELCHDFKAVLVEDATTAFSEKIHKRALAIYRLNPLYPLFKVALSQTLLKDLSLAPP